MISADIVRFLEQELRIPPAWIYRANVIFSQYDGHKDMELKNLMLAHDFHAAFDVFVNHMAVTMVLEGKREPEFFSYRLPRILEMDIIIYI
jgi:hypothetical protein